MTRRAAAAVAALLALSALGVRPPATAHPVGAAPNHATSRICPGGHRVEGVVRCRALYDGARPLHLPADPSATLRYGALERGGARFQFRDGRAALTPAVRSRLEQRALAGRAPYARLVYLARVVRGRVVALRPVVRVSEAALLDRFLAGHALDGAIATWDGQEYDDSRMVPIRLELDDRASGTSLSGRIVNADRRVRASGGRCLRSLTSWGDANPLRGPFTARIGITRFPSMHAPFDDEMLLVWNADVTNMGPELFPSAASALGADQVGPVWHTAIHGTPSLGPSVVVRLTTAGGAPCH